MILQLPSYNQVLEGSPSHSKAINGEAAEKIKLMPHSGYSNTSDHGKSLPLKFSDVNNVFHPLKCILHHQLLMFSNHLLTWV